MTDVLAGDQAASLITTPLPVLRRESSACAEPGVKPDQAAPARQKAKALQTQSVLSITMQTLSQCVTQKTALHSVQASTQKSQSSMQVTVVIIILHRH